MNNEPNRTHITALFKDAHWRSLLKDKCYFKDHVCSHGLEAEDIENLAEDLGYEILAEILKESRLDRD